MERALKERFVINFTEKTLFTASEKHLKHNKAKSQGNQLHSKRV